MPTYFPTKDSLENFNSSWVSNIHNNYCPKLEPKAIEILLFINNYLNVDNLQQSISPKKARRFELRSVFGRSRI